MTLASLRRLCVRVCVLLLSLKSLAHAVAVSRIEPGWCVGEVECAPIVALGSPIEIVADLFDVAPGTAFFVRLESTSNATASTVLGNPFVTQSVFRLAVSPIVPPGEYRIVFDFNGVLFLGGPFSFVFSTCSLVAALPARPRSKKRSSSPDDSLDLPHNVVHLFAKRQSGSPVACLLAGGPVSGTCSTAARCSVTAHPTSDFVTGCQRQSVDTLCCPNNVKASWGACTVANATRPGRCVDQSQCWTTPTAKSASACGEFPDAIKCCPPEPVATPAPTNPAASCPPDFFGPQCSLCPLCLYGDCNDGVNGSGKCVCAGNFDGALCDDCKSGFAGFSCTVQCPACRDGGVCRDGRNGDGSCVCAAGWQGSTCETRMTDGCPAGQWGRPPNCAACPACRNGLCERDTGRCKCYDGAEGALCDTCQLDYFGANCTRCPACFSGYCRDGSFGDGQCACTSGFTGPQCSSCLNGFFGQFCAPCPACVNGRCDDGIGGAGRCVCDRGWAGDTCSTCAPGFTGPTCSAPVSMCAANQFGELPNCRNCSACDTTGGYCDSGPTGTGNCICTFARAGRDCAACAAGRFGRNCEPCPNCGAQGTCRDGMTGSGRCQCRNNFRGEFCNISPSGVACGDSSGRCLDSDPRCPPCPRTIDEQRIGLCTANLDWCVNRLRGVFVNETNGLPSVRLGSRCQTGVCCMESRVSKPSPTLPLNSALAFEQPRAPVRMPLLVGSYIYLSWSGGGPTSGRDLAQLVAESDASKSIDLGIVDMRAGTARLLLQHPLPSGFIAPGTYRVRLQRAGGVSLSDAVVIGAAACQLPTVGQCVERSLCDSLGASNWIATTGSPCPGFDSKIVCCSNRLQAGAVMRDANRSLIQPTMAPTPARSLDIVILEPPPATTLAFTSTPEGYAAIIGGCIAALLICCLLLLLVLCVVRRRRRGDMVITNNSLYHTRVDESGVPMDAIVSPAVGTLRGNDNTLRMPASTSTIALPKYNTVGPGAAGGGSIKASGGATVRGAGAATGTMKGGGETVLKRPANIKPVYPQPAYSTGAGTGTATMSARVPGAYPHPTAGGAQPVYPRPADTSIGSYQNPGVDDDVPQGYSALPQNASNAAFDPPPGSYTPLPADAQSHRR